MRLDRRGHHSPCCLLTMSNEVRGASPAVVCRGSLGGERAKGSDSCSDIGKTWCVDAASQRGGIAYSSHLPPEGEEREAAQQQPTRHHRRVPKTGELTTRGEPPISHTRGRDPAGSLSPQYNKSVLGFPLSNKILGQDSVCVCRCSAPEGEEQQSVT